MEARKRNTGERKIWKQEKETPGKEKYGCKKKFSNSSNRRTRCEERENLGKEGGTDMGSEYFMAMSQEIFKTWIFLFSL